MADRMRVTSFMGDTGRLERRGKVLVPHRRGARNLRPPSAPNPLRRPTLFPVAGPETRREYTSRLVPNLRLFRHAARYRTIAGPALQRCRAVPYPAARLVPNPGTIFLLARSGRAARPEPCPSGHMMARWHAPRSPRRN